MSEEHDVRNSICLPVSRPSDHKLPLLYICYQYLSVCFKYSQRFIQRPFIYFHCHIDTHCQPNKSRITNYTGNPLLPYTYAHQALNNRERLSSKNEHQLCPPKNRFQLLNACFERETDLEFINKKIFFYFISIDILGQ